VSNPNSFEIHLQSLADFAWELESQLEALRLTRDRLSALGEKEEPLGGFPEAFSLGDRHRRAAQEMGVLLESIQQVLGFAAGVTRAVATSYAEYDEQAAAMLRQGVLGGPFSLSPSLVASSPVVAPPPVAATPVLPPVVAPAVPPPRSSGAAASGTVYYSSQYRSTPTPDQPDAN